MNSTWNKFIWFTVGAAVGSAVTWKFLKTKYERLAQEEIDSVKEVFSRIHADTPNNESPVGVTTESTEPTSSNIREYAAKLSEQGYTNYSDVEVSAKGGDPIMNDGERPYVIPPDEFGTIDDYDTISLTYYADGVVADDLDYRVENVDEVIGLESLCRFGEFEDDAVFVRNDELKSDYEILRDTRRYEDVTRATGPRRVGG